MAARPSWSGNASELLRVVGYLSRDEAPRKGVGWPKSPRALAGRLRRAQTPLRALGIEMSFVREGPAGTRMIRLVARGAKPTYATLSTVSTVSGDIAQKAID
jgi:hypothetical protein